MNAYVHFTYYVFMQVVGHELVRLTQHILLDLFKSPFLLTVDENETKNYKCTFCISNNLIIFTV